MAYKRRRPHNFTEEEMLKLLDTIFDEYIKEDSGMSWHSIMIYKHQLVPTTLQHWIENYPSVKASVKMLNSVRNVKVDEALMEGKGGGSLIWFSKATMGYVSAEVQAQIDSNAKIADKEQTIRIGYSE